MHGRNTEIVQGGVADAANLRGVGDERDTRSADIQRRTPPRAVVAPQQLEAFAELGRARARCADGAPAPSGKGAPSSLVWRAGVSLPVRDCWAVACAIA